MMRLYSSRHLRVIRPAFAGRIFYCTVFTCWLSAPISLGHYDWRIGATEQGFSLV